MYETLTDPATDSFEEDSATEYEETVCTLNLNYQVEYRSSEEHANADALSCLPCDNSPMKE